jgi:hypothetical protein
MSESIFGIWLNHYSDKEVSDVIRNYSYAAKKTLHYIELIWNQDDSKITADNYDGQNQVSRPFLVYH